MGPIVNETQASFVANQMHEQLFNEVLEPIPGTKGAHFMVWDRGMAAGVVKVEGVPVAAGMGAELNKTLNESNEGRFKGRWTGERPLMRVSQNNRLGAATTTRPGRAPGLSRRPRPPPRR